MKLRLLLLDFCCLNISEELFQVWFTFCGAYDNHCDTVYNAFRKSDNLINEVGYSPLVTIKSVTCQQQCREVRCLERLVPPVKLYPTSLNVSRLKTFEP